MLLTRFLMASGVLHKTTGKMLEMKMLLNATIDLSLSLGCHHLPLIMQSNVKILISFSV